MLGFRTAAAAAAAAAAGGDGDGGGEVTESGWQQVQRTFLFVNLSPRTRSCLQSKCAARAGWVKYEDRSPMSPALVASWGRDWLHIWVTVVTWEASFKEEEKSCALEPHCEAAATPVKAARGRGRSLKLDQHDVWPVKKCPCMKLTKCWPFFFMHNWPIRVVSGESDEHTPRSP